MNKVVTCALFLSLLITTASAQNAEASSSSDLPKLTTATPAAPLGKEVTIDFRNICERSVAIFAGPKENIRSPRIETFGGLSNYQKFYLRENDVVCIMAPDKSPKACAIIKPGMTRVEVNSSGNGISGK